jgi:hypothetical protein
MKARIALLSIAAAAGIVACSGDSLIAPIAGHRASADSAALPGQMRLTAEGGEFTPINCVPRRSSEGSAVIGPSGGTLYIGRHRLIVPAGALHHRVLISGSVPAGKPFEINLEPHGLQFHKAAGLILDARSCMDVPNIVYLIDQYTVSPPILATYSNWWHTFACPIWHFSGYAIAFRTSPDDDASGSE